MPFQILIGFASLLIGLAPRVPIPIELIWVKAEYAPPAAQRPTIIRNLKRHLSRLPVRTTIKSREFRRADPCVRARLYDEKNPPYGEVYNCYERLKSRAPRRLSIVVAGPWLGISGRMFVTGQAITCAGLPGYAVVNTTSSLGSTVHSEVALAHEIGHLLGARHTSGSNPSSIMISDALTHLNRGPMAFVRQSRLDVMECMANPRWR